MLAKIVEGLLDGEREAILLVWDGVEREYLRWNGLLVEGPV
jgi:hypothetical protein